MRNYSDFIGKNISVKSKSRNTKGFIVLVLFSLMLIYLLLSKFLLTNKKNYQEIPNSSKNTLSSEKKDRQTTASPLKTSKLIEKIEKEISAKRGTYSIYVYDINNKKDYGINPQMVITAASVNKIPILATLYHLAGKEELNLEKIIVPQPSDIQNYGTGSIRYDPIGTPYSIKTLSRLMMEKSDNTAAYLLGTQIVGLSRIQKQIENWGLTQTDMIKNTTSAKDMAIILTKMYLGEITNSALTAEMLGFMDKSDFDDRLPAGLPADIKIYHKTGDEVGKIHDVGIIDLPQRPYYLGILTTDITNEKETKETLAAISKLVFDWMKNL